MVAVRGAAAVLVVLTGLVMIPLPGSAQASEGVLYFTALDDPNGPAASAPCDNHAYSMTEDAPEDGKAYFGTSTTALACSAFFIHTVTGPFALSGDATATLYLSCDQPVVVGTPATTAYRIRLFKNADQISQTDLPGGSGACTGPGTVTEIVAPGLDTGDEQFVEGDLFRVGVIVWNSEATGSVQGNFHFLVGPTHPSRIAAVGLPGAGGVLAPPGQIHDNLTGEAALVRHVFTNATSAVYHYNWTTNATELLLEAMANVTSGSANITIIDAANATVANLTFSVTGNQSGNQSMEADANGTGAPAGNTTMNVTGEPGNWTIHIVYDNFTGNLTLSLGARPEPEPAPPAPPTTTSESEATGGFPLHREEETPGLTVVPLLAIVALAATAVRRRL